MLFSVTCTVYVTCYFTNVALCYVAYIMLGYICNTVNPEIFARTLFSLLFANSLPRENKVLANKELK